MRLFRKADESAPKKADQGTPKTTDVSLDSPKTGLPELDESPKLLKLMLFALNEACKEIARTGGQTPLAVIETPAGQFIQGFKGKRLEFEYEEARQALLTAPSEAERYALAWAGYLTLQGVRYETVMIGGGERGKPRGATMGLRYKQQLPEVRFQPIGNPKILGPGDNLLTMASDPEAASKLRPAFERITADVDHNRASGNGKAPAYEFRSCPELILSFGDLDLPFRKELQKKPDSVHVVMNRRTWMTVFKPDEKEVFLNRGMLFPIRGNEPFMGFNEDGLIMICYMPPVPTGDKAPADVGMVVYWMAEFKITEKGRT
jgi:hypothetical protein